MSASLELGVDWGNSKMAKSMEADRNPKLVETIRARSYVLMRIVELAETLKTHGIERAELTKRIQDTPGEGGPELRKLRDRRLYLAKRIEILREEQRTLQATKKDVNQTAAKLRRG